VSEIPFVNQLGDAFDRAVAAESARRSLRRPWWRRPQVLIAIAVVAVACGAVAARTVLNSSTLAMHPIECLSGTTFKSQIAFPENNGRSPVQICANALGVPASRLIACAGGRYTYVSVFYASGAGQCRRLGLRPLPASYPAAQAKVRELARALTALEASRYCVPPATFAARAQGTLDRLGFSGWRVEAGSTAQEEAHVIGGGDCASLPGDPLSTRPNIMYALDPDHRVLSFDLGPPPRLSRLVQTLAVSIQRATAMGCSSQAGLRASVRQRLARHHLGAAFAVTAAPPSEGFGEVWYHRYQQGCPVAGLLRTAAGNLGLIDVWVLQRGAASPPGHGLPPQRAFH
jgi:hypothetical protein